MIVTIDEAANIDWKQISKPLLPTDGKVIIISTPKPEELIYFTVHRYLYRYESLRKKLKKMAKNKEIKFAGYSKTDKLFYYQVTKEQHKILIQTYIRINK